MDLLWKLSITLFAEDPLKPLKDPCVYQEPPLQMNQTFRFWQSLSVVHFWVSGEQDAVKLDCTVCM